jgi:uncharacterized protein YukE
MGPKNITTPIKPPEVSSRTQEENEDIHNMFSKLEEQINDLSDNSNIWVNSQRHIQEIESNMDENKEEIQNSMKEMKNSISSMIYQSLNDRLPIRDIKIQGTHENKGSIHVE